MSSILELKTNETVKHSAKISKQVADNLATLKNRITSEAPTLQLNVDLIVERAIASAVKKATKELDEKRTPQGQ